MKVGGGTKTANCQNSQVSRSTENLQGNLQVDQGMIVEEEVNYVLCVFQHLSASTIACEAHLENLFKKIIY